MKRMLINATQPEELRVAIADGQHLFDLDIEVPSQEQKKSNVYKGKITRVEPSLEACFVEFGSTRHGFLPLKEICPSCYVKGSGKKDGKVAIRDVVREGQEIIVQVEKEERGNKGAALTTYISLAGRYLVLMPTNPSAGGVSRRITGNDRDHLREQLQNVTTPNNVGIIVRTAGVGRDADELQWDLDYLLQLWSAIEQAAAQRSAPFLIYQESNLFIRALRDHLRNDIGEILIDNETVYNDAREFMQQVMPHNLGKLKLYNDQVPLFNRYQIESQIESAFARTVHLPSGGAVVFDRTEALLSIDINSARATKGSDIEETAFNTNMESANEIARQLRLRDLGGLIVIDFIDMNSRKHQREVEECLRQAMQLDKARVQIGRISRFGLLEMSRQRLRPSLGESSQETCPRCEGHGTIRSIESLALSILRLVEEEVMKDYTGQIIVQAPTEVINFLHNEKRSALAEVESRHHVPIVMLANQHMMTPQFEILRVRKSDVTETPSYDRVVKPDPQVVANERSQANAVVVAAPAVKGIVPDRPAPERDSAKAPGLFKRMAKMLFSHADEEEADKAASRKNTSQQTAGKRGGQQSRRGPAREQQSRKTSKKQGGKTAQADSQQKQQRRTSKKRPGKKTQAKSGQDQNKPDQSKQRRGHQQQADKGQAKTDQASQPVAAKSETQSESKTDAKQPQKEGGSRPTRRRRRSPYKTGGPKPRAEHSQAQGDQVDQKTSAPAENKPPAPTSADSPKAAKTDPADTQKNEDVKESAKPADKPVTETGQPTEAKAPVAAQKPESEAPAKSADAGQPDRVSAEITAAQPQKADKTTNGDNKSAATTKRAPRKKTARKKATRKPVVSNKPETAEVVMPAPGTSRADPAKADTSKPDAKPADKDATPKVAKKDEQDRPQQAEETGKSPPEKVADKPKPAQPAAVVPQKDAKGIYTLKPPPSE
ncbi:MAG: Rne/Rng family ribonuclease [Xanthomonadales bacterium]|nr:Rne/Rng family ribonuclease [Xanthomonadales bacterium]